MKLSFNDDELAFRDEMRDFFSSAVPAEIRDKVARNQHLTREDMVTSHKVLNAAGYAVTHWPVEYGGKDWTPTQRYLFSEEMNNSNTPAPQGFNAGLVGPVLYTFGNEEQRQRFLPATANLDIWWCQGFSEPNAGSDLASARTAAVRDGDHYVVNGQKMWTTLAHFADWIFALVRTDPNAPKRQMGLSFLLIDLKSPGITIRPINLINSPREVNEIFFDNVIVPAENLIGEENKGWTYAKFLLGNERGATSRVPAIRGQLNTVKRLAAETRIGGGTLLDDLNFAARVAELETQLAALEITTLRVVGASTEGRPNPVSSLLKLQSANLGQDVDELLVEVAGPDSRPFQAEGISAPDWAQQAVPTYLNQRKSTIYGGSNEVQRSIIASSILGL